MLSDFTEKMKPFFTLNRVFSKSKKSHFSKEVKPCFWTKNAIFFCLRRFREN